MPTLKTLGILLLTASTAWGCNSSTDETPPISTQRGGVPASTGGFGATGGSGVTGGALGSGGIPDASGGTPEATGGMDTPPPVNSDLPCDVQEALNTYCWNCHGEKPDFGGPMSLVTKMHFDAMGKFTPTEHVDALVKARINDVTRPMPPVSAPQMSQAAKDTLNAWLDQGAPVGDGSSCMVHPPAGTGGMDGSGGSTTSGQWQEYDTSWPGGVKPEETCYQFLKHGGQTSDDTTPHVAADGETYLNFFYKVPWTEPVVATRWRTLYDKTQILHHWLLYRSPAAQSRDGNWAVGNGTHPGAQLLAVWAVGGGDEDFPPGVGLRMPGPGSMLEVEWHLYNTTGGSVEDRSGVEVCVVPESAVNPQYVAGVHWLGTEALGLIAPNADSKRGGVCNPQMATGEKSTIVKWMPHMHLLGIHMDTWILRADGSEEHIFDKPFDFNQQIMYAQETPLEIGAGDRIHTQCTFRNDGSGYVYYGESTNNEMCYQFVFAYPAGSLDNTSTPSLSGAVNSCLSGNITHP